MDRYIYSICDFEREKERGGCKIHSIDFYVLREVSSFAFYYELRGP